MRRLFPLLLLLVSAAACAGSEPVAARVTGRDTEPRQVRTAPVISAPLVRAVTLTGTLAAEEQVTLAFKVAGRVEDVLVDLGSRVTRGQVLARLADTDFALRVQQAEAALAQARARLGLPPEGESDVVQPEQTPLVRQRRAVADEARLNRDRTKTFVERGISPRASLDSAEAALEVAESQYLDALEEIRTRQAMLAQRRSELALARQQLDDAVLRSPIDGAVRERQVAVGEYRGPGTPVLTIVRTHPLRLQLSVPEREAHLVRPGLPVRVRVEGDSRIHEGRLVRIGAAILESNRTLPVEAVVPNPGDVLRPGQFATADIVVSSGEPALVVPREAIVTFAGLQKVLTVQDGRAREQRIRTGRREGNRVEVIDGVSAGDLVILEPGDLVDGDPVRTDTSE